MSPVRVTFARTVGMARNYYATALAFGAFFAGVAIQYCINVESGEGGMLSLGDLWTVSLAPILPVLTAFLSMDTWSDERLSGRLDMLLTAPVQEWDLVLGKYLGVLAMVSAGIFTSWLSVWGVGLYLGVSMPFPVLGFLALLMQGALWCAVGVMMSARFRHAAAAATASLSLTVIMPRALWFAFVSWVPELRVPYGMMPLDAHVLDLASGIVSAGTVLGYAVTTAMMLFVNLKYVEMLRLGGYGARMYRRSARVSIFMALSVAALAVSLAMRMDVTLEMPVTEAKEFSARTQSILVGAEGEIEISGFLPRKDKRFRDVVQLLRALKREAEMSGGLKINLRFVDPRWDLGEAERLVRLGAKENSVVLRRGRRVVSVPVEPGLGEREVASAILRIVSNAQRKKVYWTVGHGEASFEQYDAWGMSDIARELSRDGYENAKLSLTVSETIPADCALVVVAGAKTDFSRAELAKIESYLVGGGRLLALVEAADATGVNSILPEWGVKPSKPSVLVAPRTLSGSDIIVSDFGDHVISSPLKGTQVILDSPVAVLPSAAAESGTGADKAEYSVLASVQGQAFAAIGERGAGTGTDLALRPTRVAVVGDALFVMNGQLSARKNANSDFFLNIVAYLSGSDTMVGSGAEAGVLSISLDRRQRVHGAVMLVVVLPLAIFVVMVVYALRRRHRR